MERSQQLDKLLGELEDLKKKFSNGQLNSKKEQASGETTQSGDESSTNRNTIQSAPPKEETPVEELPANDNAQQQEGSGQTENNSNGELESAATSEVNEAGPPEQPAEDYSNFFGEPSLGNGNSSVQPSDHSANGSQQQTAVVETQETNSAGGDTKGKTNKQVSLQEVKEAWPAYVELLRNRVQQMLYFQMQRMEPIKLKNRELTLRCADDFAKKILDENKKRLSKVLEEEIGVFLRMKCIVRKNEQEEEESKSPYERFKALQERDPKIKTLVELFGAELDYNLNQ
jgi:DNA polymerase-3 subunit gamma/tau